MNAQKCIDTNTNTHIALLQIRSTPLGQGLPSPATLLFNHPIKGIMPILNRPPVHTNNNDDHYETLVERQAKADKYYDTLRNYNSIQMGSTVVIQREDGRLQNYGTKIEKGDQKHND